MIWKTLAVLLLANPEAPAVPSPLSAAEWADPAVVKAVKADDWEALGKAGIRAVPVMLSQRKTPDADRRTKLAALIHRAYRFRMDSFVLAEATLAEACERLSEATGVTVRAEGEAAKPITVSLHDAGFWEAVLAICEKGEVGLAPAHEGFNPSRWIPGFQGNPVTLGRKHPRPEHAYASGPVLVTVRATELAGERAGTLELNVRFVPELPVRAMTVPRIRTGRDWES